GWSDSAHSELPETRLRAWSGRCGRVGRRAGRAFRPRADDRCWDLFTPAPGNGTDSGSRPPRNRVNGREHEVSPWLGTLRSRPLQVKKSADSQQKRSRSTVRSKTFASPSRAFAGSGARAPALSRGTDAQ